MIKESREQAIEFIHQRIGSCFGTADGIFAGHPADEARAKEIRSLALKSGVLLRDIEAITLNFLEQKAFHPDHIYEEMKKTCLFFSKKLS